MMMENHLDQKMNLGLRYGLCSGRLSLILTLGRFLERLTCNETPADSTADHSETCMSCWNTLSSKVLVVCYVSDDYNIKTVRV